MKEIEKEEAEDDVEGEESEDSGEGGDDSGDEVEGSGDEGEEGSGEEGEESGEEDEGDEGEEESGDDDAESGDKIEGQENADTNTATGGSVLPGTTIGAGILSDRSFASLKVNSFKFHLMTISFFTSNLQHLCSAVYSVAMILDLQVQIYKQNN